MNKYLGFWYVEDAEGDINGNNFNHLKTLLIAEAKKHVRRGARYECIIKSYETGKVLWDYTRCRCPRPDRGSRFHDKYICAVVTTSNQMNKQFFGSNWKCVRALASEYTKALPRGTEYCVKYLREAEGIYIPFRQAKGVRAIVRREYIAYIRPDFQHQWKRADFPDGKNGVYSDRDLAWRAIEKNVPKGTLAKVCQHIV